MAEESYYYGELKVDSDLSAVVRVLDKCSWKVELRKGDEGEAPYLRSVDVRIDLDMDAGQGPTYRFSGAVSGNTGTAAELLSSFSQCLTEGKIQHRIEIYEDPDEGEPVAYLHYNRPRAS